MGKVGIELVGVVEIVGIVVVVGVVGSFVRCGWEQVEESSKKTQGVLSRQREHCLVVGPLFVVKGWTKRRQ